MQITYLQSNHNYKVPVCVWPAALQTNAVVLIVHGMAEFASRYTSFAATLQQQNITVYAADSQGHGNAVANNNELGIVQKNWFNNQVDDLNSIVQYLKNEHPSKKIFLLGHSMGSFLCQRFHQLHGASIDGLILSATNGKKDPLMGAGIFIAKMQAALFGKNYKSNLLTTLSFGKFNKAFAPNRTAFDWLSRDNNEVDKYINNPLCGFTCSAIFFFYFFKGIQDVFNKENNKAIPKHVPVYLFAGTKDPVGLFTKGFLQLITNWKNIGVQNIAYNLYEDGRHEMLNEINKDEVIANLQAWLNTQIQSTK